MCVLYYAGRGIQGWMGDALFASEESMYNFDMQAIYTSFMHSVQDNQGPVSGDVPYVVPGSTPGPSSCNDLAWSSAYPGERTPFAHFFLLCLLSSRACLGK